MRSDETKKYRIRIAPGMVAQSDSLWLIVRVAWMAWVGIFRLWWQSRKYR
jgi:hypothetical protein